ncbi:uncharacterized protein LOC120704851 isoform X1 [Panicum virgatum]|uniref:uncharacterized protein LOC120704851 isoform X1 n=1 Tax=Panicum virgatum TaxID=38727 RepID=UPI0019D63B50|nr:uncharacterized protein LOC120704851 isoform X1 [Panicum virgatum]
MGDDDDTREVAALHGRRRRGEGDDRWDGDGGWWVSGSTEGPAAGTVSGGSSAATWSLFSSTSSLTDEEEDGEGGATSASSRPDRVLPGVVGVGNGADGRGRRRDGRRAALRAVHDARGSSGSQNRAVQVVQGKIPVLHIAGRCQLRGGSREEDYPLHQKKEAGAQVLR